MFKVNIETLARLKLVLLKQSGLYKKVPSIQLTGYGLQVHEKERQ